MNQLAVILLALSSITARAQAPEQLLDRFVATGDWSLLERCGAVLNKLPRTHPTRILSARLTLARGDKEEALTAARAINRYAPDDLNGYALLVDAARALGRTEEAEQAAQWMLNLRPEDSRGLLRGAAVREDLDDLSGAEDMLLASYQRTGREDAFVRAHIATSLARLAAKRGNVEAARRLLKQAFDVVPGYRPAAALLETLPIQKDKP